MRTASAYQSPARVPGAAARGSTSRAGVSGAAARESGHCQSGRLDAPFGDDNHSTFRGGAGHGNNPPPGTGERGDDIRLDAGFAEPLRGNAEVSRWLSGSAVGSVVRGTGLPVAAQLETERDEMASCSVGDEFRPQHTQGAFEGLDYRKPGLVDLDCTFVDRLRDTPARRVSTIVLDKS